MIGLAIPKKADITVVQGLLMFLAVTIVLAVFFAGVLPYLREASDKELCRVSVMAKYGGKMAKAGAFESSIPLQCYTQTLTVTKDGIYKVGKKRSSREIARFPSGTSQEDIDKKVGLVKKAVADEMYDCWDQFWQGKLAIFTSGNRCVVCSEISFESNWIDPSAGSLQDIIPTFGDYLNTQKINKEQTYADYFGGQFENNFALNPRITTKLVFKAVSQGWLSKWIDMTVFGCLTTLFGVGAGAVSSAFQDTDAPISRTLIVASALTPLGLAGPCLTGFVIGAGKAVVEGSDWVPSMIVGPSGVVAQNCDRMY